MATKCAHCGSVAYTRSSRMLSPVSQEEYFQCSNVACGHTFTAVREHRETLSPSATPNPAVRLRIADRARLIAIQIAMRKTANDDQLPLLPDETPPG